MPLREHGHRKDGGQHAPLGRVHRLDLGSFIRPPAETATGVPRIEPVWGYAVSTAHGAVLFDTGLGALDAETEAWYRPQRIDVRAALKRAGIGRADVALIVNCHMHFDHIGGNPHFPGIPIVSQRGELETARSGDYTIPQLVDFPGATHELIDGETEIFEGVHVIPTPGHVLGHQSLVVEQDNGSIVLLGQGFDSASEWSSEVLAARAESMGHREPLPVPRPWVERLLAFDPREVVFAHDGAVWIP